MEARKSKAKKWTDLPKDYINQVINALRQSFADENKSGRFVVEGRIYPDELILRMGFAQKGQIRQKNFEISADYKAGKEDTLKILNLCVDVGATLLEELFSSTDDSEFPRLWEAFEVEGRTVFVQFSSDNSELESKANQVLGTKKGRLVEVTDDADDELEAIKAKLGLDDLDDDDLDKDLSDDEEDEDPEDPEGTGGRVLN